MDDAWFGTESYHFTEYVYDKFYRLSDISLWTMRSSASGETYVTAFEFTMKTYGNQTGWPEIKKLAAPGGVTAGTRFDYPIPYGKLSSVKMYHRDLTIDESFFTGIHFEYDDDSSKNVDIKPNTDLLSTDVDKAKFNPTGF